MKRTNKTNMLLLKRLTAFIAVFLVASGCFAQHGEGQKIDKALQKQEIKRMVKELRKDNTLQQLSPTEPKTQASGDFSMISYRVMGRTRIQFGNGEWIYFLPHSSHASPAVGDVCVAITSKDKVYVNYGHICAGDMVHYICNACQTPASTAEFLERFVADVDESRWVKW